jgi:hypothetical protein
MHVNSLCACSHSEAMKGSSSLTSCRLLILSRLLASPVWAQLMLTDPTWGARSLYLQNGDPFHRVRAHSLTGVQNRKCAISVYPFAAYKWKFAFSVSSVLCIQYPPLKIPHTKNGFSSLKISSSINNGHICSQHGFLHQRMNTNVTGTK